MNILASNDTIFTAKLIQSKQYDEAEKLISALLQNTPNNSFLLYQMGYVKYLKKKHDDAISYLTLAIKHNNKMADFYYYRGLSNQKINKILDAKKDFQKAIKIDNKKYEYHRDYSNLLLNEGSYDLALNHIETSIKYKNNDYSLINTRAVCYLKLHMYEMALNDLNLLIDTNNYLNEAMVNKAHTLLSLGNFDEAWEFFEFRFKLENSGSISRKFEQSEWDGQKEGGSILIWSEQGIGDQIMCLTFLSNLIDKFDKIIVACDERLIKIYQRSYNEQFCFISKDSDMDQLTFDFHLPMFGLLKFFLSTKNHQKPMPSNIKIDVEKNKIISQNIKNDKKYIIGISWFSINPYSGKPRSYSLIDFLKPFHKNKDDYLCINLQYGAQNAEIENAKKILGVDLINYDEINLYRDIDGLMTLASLCDHIISIDNSTVHLCGAAGFNTHILLTRGWDWRWLDGRNIWYENTKCYAQKPNEDKLKFSKSTIKMILENINENNIQNRY